MSGDAREKCGSTTTFFIERLSDGSYWMHQSPCLTILSNSYSCTFSLPTSLPSSLASKHPQTQSERIISFLERFIEGQVTLPPSSHTSQKSSRSIVVLGNFSILTVFIPNILQQYDFHDIKLRKRLL